MTVLRKKNDSIGTNIHISANYIKSYSDLGDVQKEVKGIIMYYLSPIWAWDGNGKAPMGLVTGIANYMRWKAGLESKYWMKPGQGDRYDQGFEVTGYFLAYCESLSAGFVAHLNHKMKHSYSDRYRYELLGKNVDELWADCTIVN